MTPPRTTGKTGGQLMGCTGGCLHACLKVPGMGRERGHTVAREGWGASCQILSLQPAVAATACPTVACWCVSFPTGKAGRLSAQPSPDTVPGSVSVLRTSSLGKPQYGSSSAMVLHIRVSSSSIDNICTFLLLPQNLGLPMIWQMARIPFLAPCE